MPFFEPYKRIIRQKAESAIRQCEDRRRKSSLLTLERLEKQTGSEVQGFGEYQRRDV
jgi:hypothetical protein